MKNLVKLFLLVVLTTAISANMFAQDESDDITVSAVVLAPLTITKNTDVDFKNISATTPDIVRMTPGATPVYAYTGNGATMGKFTIGAANSTQILISYDAGEVLMSGTDELEFSVHVFGHTSDDMSASSALTAEGIAGDDVNTTTSASGAYFLYVGGALGGSIGAPAALNGQAQGSYTGTMTFEVKYN